MDFSVVIATKDRQEYLRRTLESLEGQTHAPPFEVIVIDNGSADETKSVVDACAGRSVPNAHGTAVASVLVGLAEDFRGVQDAPLQLTEARIVPAEGKTPAYSRSR